MVFIGTTNSIYQKVRGVLSVNFGENFKVAVGIRGRASSYDRNSSGEVTLVISKTLFVELVPIFG